MGRAVWIDDDPFKVQSALDEGFDPNYYDNDGATTLHRVAEAGCFQALEVFLNHDLTRIDLKDHLQRTPLHYAARCSNFDKSKEICAKLLNAGLNIEEECNDVDYPTALFYCVKYNNFKLAGYLLENGADIDKVNFSDAKILLQFVLDARYHATENVEFAALLLYYNVDVNFPLNGHPLITALLYGKFQIAMLLFDYFTDYDYSKLLDDYSYTSTIRILINQCMISKCDSDSIINMFEKIKWNVKELMHGLIQSGRSTDLKLFTFFYDKLQTYNNIKTMDWSLNLFFEVTYLSKTDYITAIERLFHHDFGVVFDSHTISYCIPLLFLEIKPSLKLELHEMEIILYHMFQFANYLCGEALYETFEVSGWSNEFEIILKFDPLVAYSYHCERALNVFENISFPGPELIRCDDGSAGMVQSLTVLSRNAVRSRLGNCRSQSMLPQHIFAYYNKVHKLKNLPRIVKDIITLKYFL